MYNKRFKLITKLSQNQFYTDGLTPRTSNQQPGCLHANMDLYKWAYKLTPIVPSGLVADAFELAREIRELDMRASPYDLSALGYSPVRIETADGKREYVAAQRAFAERAGALRDRLRNVLAPLVDGHLAWPA